MEERKAAEAALLAIESEKSQLLDALSEQTQRARRLEVEAKEVRAQSDTTRRDLERANALASEHARDAAATKMQVRCSLHLAPA